VDDGASVLDVADFGRNGCLAYVADKLLLERLLCVYGQCTVHKHLARNYSSKWETNNEEFCKMKWGHLALHIFHQKLVKSLLGLC